MTRLSEIRARLDAAPARTVDFLGNQEWYEPDVMGDRGAIARRALESPDV